MNSKFKQVWLVGLVGLWLGLVMPGYALGQSCTISAGANDYVMETQAGCDPTLGTVRLGIDAFGATGSASGGARACYDPADDQPNQGMVSTIFESMAF